MVPRLATDPIFFWPAGGGNDTRNARAEAIDKKSIRAWSGGADIDKSLDRVSTLESLVMFGARSGLMANTRPFHLKPIYDNSTLLVVCLGMYVRIPCRFPTGCTWYGPLPLYLVYYFVMLLLYDNIILLLLFFLALFSKRHDDNCY